MYKIGIISAILLILFFAILDLTVLPYMRIGEAKPDPFLVLVLFFALYGGLRVGVKLGFVAGLLKDIFTSGIFGVNALFLGCLGALFGYNFSKFYREKVLTQLILTFLIGISYSTFYYIFFKFINTVKDRPLIDIGIWQFLGTIGVPFSLYTAIIAPPTFYILRKIFRIRY